MGKDKGVQQNDQMSMADEDKDIDIDDLRKLHHDDQIEEDMMAEWD